jgi:GT2 family glycosyltransferase
MFSIILPIYDPFDRLVLSSAIQYTMKKVLALEGSFELIIVNNNPIRYCPYLTQYLRTLKESYPKTIKLIEPDDNTGTARGFNLGLRVADSKNEFLIFMSQDADIVDSRMLNKIYKNLTKEPNVGIAHPISIYEDNDEYNYSKHYSRMAFLRMIRRRLPYESSEISQEELQLILSEVSRNKGIKAPMRSFPLTFAIFRRDIINKIGTFDEMIEKGCYEVDDLAYRCLLSGFLVARLNGVFVNHRRYLFHSLCARDPYSLPHQDAIRQSHEFWVKKWGRPPIELYAKWRYGKFLFLLMLPYYWLRRCICKIKQRIESFIFIKI